jgi:hypothetical protein
LDPTRRQWPKTQPIGESLWRDGARGVLAPSAAREGGRVLAIFRPAATAATAGAAGAATTEIQGVKPIPPPRRFTRLPALPPGLRT